MERRYLRDLSELCEEKSLSRKKRDRPVFVADIGNKQPLTVLESLIKLWPMHDLRYKNSDMPYYNSYDDPLTVDLVKGMESKVVRKDFDQGILEIAIEIQKNMGAFERYNLVVEKHNEEWFKRGCPETVFDPVHGEVHPIKDKFVDPAIVTSSRYPQPKSVYSKATGALGKARPSMERAPYILVRYHLQVKRGTFILGYVAYDHMDKVIYYNQISHRNLSYLVRRSVQELWGNPKATGMGGVWLEGVPMLINGKKLAICKQDNTAPEILTQTSPLKMRNPELGSTLAKQQSMMLLDTFSRKVLPIVLILFTFWFCCHELCRAFGEPRIDVKVEFMGGMLLILGGFFALRHIAQCADRQVSALEAAKKLM